MSIRRNHLKKTITNVYYSAFWKKHYKEIGTCCITSPMEKETVLDTKGKRLVSFIDVGWMNNKKLKWIGHDWDMYFAWIDPNGMIYRFKDLKRNEAGEEYEKNVRKLEIPNEGGHHHPSFSNKHDFYMWEYEVQKNCGFCPKDTAGQGGKGKPDSKKDDADSADAVAGGGVAGTGVEKEEKKETEQLAANTEPTDPTDHIDTTYTEHITDTKAVQNDEEENQLVTDYAKNDDDDPKQILDELKEKKDEKADNDEKTTKPPKQEEKTEKLNKVTKPVIPPKKDNKVLNTQKVTDNKQVTKTVVPKNLQKTTQQRTDEILSRYQQPEPIDNLQLNATKKTVDRKLGEYGIYEAVGDINGKMDLLEAVEEAKDLWRAAPTKNKNHPYNLLQRQRLNHTTPNGPSPLKPIAKINKILSAAEVIDHFGEVARLRRKVYSDTATRNNSVKLEQAKAELMDAQSAFFNDICIILIGLVAAEIITFMTALEILKSISLSSSARITQTMAVLQDTLKRIPDDTPYHQRRRSELIQTLVDLYAERERLRAQGK